LEGRKRKKKKKRKRRERKNIRKRGGETRLGEKKRACEFKKYESLTLQKKPNRQWKRETGQPAARMHPGGHRNHNKKKLGTEKKNFHRRNTKRNSLQEMERKGKKKKGSRFNQTRARPITRF